MYGMVNKAVEDMVCATYGEAMWEKVKEQAGVSSSHFGGARSLVRLGIASWRGARRQVSASVWSVAGRGPVVWELAAGVTHF